MPDALKIISKKFPILAEYTEGLPTHNAQIDADSAALLRKVLATIPDEQVGPITKATERFICSVERAAKRWVSSVGRKNLDGIAAKLTPIIFAAKAKKRAKGASKSDKARTRKREA